MKKLRIWIAAAVLCAVMAVPYLSFLPAAGVYALQIAGILLMLFLAWQSICRQRTETAPQTEKRPSGYEGLFIFALFLGGIVILLTSSREEIIHTLLIAFAALAVRYVLHTFNHC